MKKRKLVFMITFFALIFVAAYGADVNADTQIKINKKNFPDKFLREEINDNFDKNKDGYLSEKERNAVKTINMDLYEIGESNEESCNACAVNPSKEEWAQYCTFNCKGLKYFENLEELSVRLYDDYYGLGIKGKIKNYKEIYKLKNLKLLDLNGDENIKKLDLNNLKKLEKLEIRSVNVEEIKIKELMKLKDIYVSAHKLKKIDLADKESLNKLTLSTKNLKKINLKNSIKLKEIYAYAAFEKVDLSKNTKLKDIEIKSIKLEKVIFPKNNKIKRVVLRETPIKNINLNGLNPDTLKFLNLANTGIEKIDISGFPNIKRLHVNDATEVIKAEGQKSKIDSNGEDFNTWYKK